MTAQTQGELVASQREVARRLGISHTALQKAVQSGRIAPEPDGQWNVDKTRRRLVETADPSRSPLGGSATADGTPFARLKVAQLALKVEAQRLALGESKRRLVDVADGTADKDYLSVHDEDAEIVELLRDCGVEAIFRLPTSRKGRSANVVIDPTFRLVDDGRTLASI